MAAPSGSACWGIPARSCGMPPSHDSRTASRRGHPRLLLSQPASNSLRWIPHRWRRALGIQFLGLLAVVVEVVVGRGPLVEVVAFGVVHQRKFIVAVGVHVLQPCGEFHVVDVEINADFGELATQLVAEFRAVRVGVGEGEFQRIIGGIAGFSMSSLALFTSYGYRSVKSS